jgi:Rieske Fe-S protein
MDADQFVSRRELVRFAVITSAALFTSTVVLAVLGRAASSKRGGRQAIAGGAQLAEGQALYFKYPTGDDQAVLINVPGTGLVAYSQKCTHLSCSVYYQAEERRLRCPCHEGFFSAATGEPIAGPPQRNLRRITLTREGDTLYALEETP